MESLEAEKRPLTYLGLKAFLQNVKNKQYTNIYASRRSQYFQEPVHF